MRRLAGALLLGALFAVAASAATACPSGRIDATARVAQVIDGDTVILADGRHVRLIGLDTPEIGRRGKPSQPYAQAARRALVALLAAHHERVALRYGQQRRDHYGRTLAHLFLPDGASVTAFMLGKGLGTALIVPPNVWNARCYAAAENTARERRIGIWSLPRYQPKAVSALPKRADGFYVIRARVQRVGRSPHALWIDLGHKTALRIPKEDLAYFDAVDFNALRGRMIQAQGWIHTWNRGDRVMTLRYPMALSIE